MVRQEKSQSHKMAKRMVVLRLQKTENISERIRTFWFQPETGFEYLAGQAAEFVLPHESPDERSERRWFTLSSSPTEKLLAITTTRGNSSFKQALFALKPSEQIQAMPAMGDFVLPKSPDIPLVFVAGGIGITPVRSIIKYLTDVKEGRQVHLVYSLSNHREYIFGDILEGYPLKKTLRLTRDLGRLNAGGVLDLTNIAAHTLVYVSGSQSFTTHLTEGLKQRGISPDKIIADFFSGY